MPLGNGETAICLWVEEDGDLQFYIGRSDALTELDRNVKLGKIRVSLSPNPFGPGRFFRQKLELRCGQAEVTAGEGKERVRLRVFVDADSDTVYVLGESAAPVVVGAAYESWRTAYRSSGDDSPLGVNPPVPIRESPDIVREDGDGMLFFHRNEATCVRYHAEQQGIADRLDAVPDSLSGRIFGGRLTLTEAGPAGPGRLASRYPLRSFAVAVTTLSEQTADQEAWIAKLRAAHRGSPAEAAAACARTAAWWEAYWQQSWMFVAGDRPPEPAVDPGLFALAREPFVRDAAEETPPSFVTQAYLLTKWMFMCTGRGAFPILFNGALFNGMPGGGRHYSVEHFGTNFTAMPDREPDLAYNPDERPWGHMNLWQNQRLPYYSMLPRGETAALRVLFRYYRRFWELNRVRAKAYYGAEGQHNTEITTSFGLQPAWVYGFERAGLPPGYAANRWGGAIDLSPGLELAHTMLEYYDYTADDDFLRDELLPYAKDLLRYIETRFPARADGKLVISPIHAVETYFDTTDSMPVVAGMHAVLKRILALPEDKVPDRPYFAAMLRLTPAIPVETVGERRYLLPARVFEPVRKNIEMPELYAIFPFALYKTGLDDLEMARASLGRALEVSGGNRPFVLGQKPDYASYSGWQQTGMVAALLGLAEEAREIVERNCRLSNPGFRFPAMWGPFYDAVPDVDHGANLLTTLQLMAFQTTGDAIAVLPAWPKEWNVAFKLHAPRNTTVECEYRDGRIVRLEVNPPERMKDVIIRAEDA